MRDDAVVVVRVAGRGIERFVAALRAADEIRALGRTAVGLLDDLERRVMTLLHRLLAEVPQRLVIERERAVESLRGLVAAVGAERDEALFQRVVHVGWLQRERTEPGHQRPVVAAAAHLQDAPVPRHRQVDLEFEIRRARVLRLHDAGDLAVVAVRVALRRRRHGHRRLHDRTAGRKTDRSRRNRQVQQAGTRRSWQRCAVLLGQARSSERHHCERDEQVRGRQGPMCHAHIMPSPRVVGHYGPP